MKQHVLIGTAIVVFASFAFFVWLELRSTPNADTNLTNNNDPVSQNVPSAPESHTADKDVLEGVEAKTFSSGERLIGSTLHSPQKRKTLEIAAPEQLEHLGSGIYVDGVNLYSLYYGPQNDAPITIPSPGSNDYDALNGDVGNDQDDHPTVGTYFRVSNTLYVLIDGPYYAGLLELPVADLASFRPLNSSYAKDKDRIYHKDTIISDADPNSFTLLLPDNANYAKDQHNVYFAGQVLPKVDPESARVQKIDGSDAAQGGTIWLLFTPDFVYFEDTKLKDIRPQHLTTEKNGQIIKDGDTTYYMYGNCHGGRWYIPASEYSASKYAGGVYRGWC